MLRVLEIDLGFRAEGVTAMSVSLPAAQYRHASRIVRFYSELHRRLETLRESKAPESFLNCR
jgi:hypothetical protein